jgi:RNA polymerase sigma factor (TIGR02999 family)
MDEAPPVDVTTLLQRIGRGDRDAEPALLSLVYDHLHRMASRQFRLERPGHTLQPTALLSELYIRLLRDSTVDWQGRAHFYAVAAQTIRRILIDHARAARAQRRPQSRQRVHIDEVLLYSDERAEDVLMIDEALRQLEAWDARQAQVVTLRYFGGLSVEETAQSLGISARTVKREWSMARAWLSARLNGAGRNA